MDAQVTAAEESPCPVTLEAFFAGEDSAFDDVKTQAEAALRALFGELAVGQPLYIARMLIGTVMAVPGVENCPSHRSGSRSARGGAQPHHPG